ncbi:MAG: PilZ domain-containing protein [Phycisphaerae bacterium]|nr:PilZ domain-containing protein [Phycisphaerae bacterium]
MTYASVTTSPAATATLAGTSSPARDPFWALNAVERLEAARNMSDDTSSSWLWVALWLVLGLLVLSSIGLIIYGVCAVSRRRRKAFERQGRQSGLSGAEVDTAWNVARAARLKDPSTVFTSEPAFARGVSAYFAGSAFGGLSVESQQSIVGHIESLREKLLRRPTKTPSQTDRQPLNTGGEVSVVHRGQAGGYAGTIREVTDSELVIESDLPPETTRPGEAWLVRYPNGGTVWEFDTSLLRREKNRFVLNRPETFRYINRRRFARMATDMPAQVAETGGIESADADNAPTFLPGNVVEIAGPGLQIASALQARVGQNVLAVVHIDEDKKIRAVGTVRRVQPGEGDTTLLAMELTGLSEEQTAELVRATNAAARNATAPAETGEQA